MYKKGKENRVGDSLTRTHESDSSLCAISIGIPGWTSEFQSEYAKDLETTKIIEEVENNKATNSKFSWEKYIHAMVQTKNIFTQFIKFQNSSLKREP